MNRVNSRSALCHNRRTVNTGDIITIPSPSNNIILRQTARQRLSTASAAATSYDHVDEVVADDVDITLQQAAERAGVLAANTCISITNHAQSPSL